MLLASAAGTTSATLRLRGVGASVRRRWARKSAGGLSRCFLRRVLASAAELLAPFGPILGRRYFLRRALTLAAARAGHLRLARRPVMPRVP